MGIHQPEDTSPVLDEMLLDVAIEIELTDNDRAIAERRYQRLKVHLERPESPLRGYLADASSQIYPQGSMSIGTAIVSGDNDDRYDLDTIVEIAVPADWTPEKVKEALFEALQDFPGVEEIEKCTRCVQLRFANMHMDVTILDPKAEPRPPRQGAIFHVPDKGRHVRVPSNPYGFSSWYRETIVAGGTFEKAIRTRRGTGNRRSVLKENLVEKVLAAAQEKLPTVIPPALDSQQAVALKLQKRYLNTRYARLKAKRPPSIYFTKHSADVGFIETGLTDQLIALAQFTATQLRECIAKSSKPDERNPRYHEDRLNDRWPSTDQEMETCIKALDELAHGLHAAKSMTLPEISKALAEMFGERISTAAYGSFVERYDQSNSRKGLEYEKRTGAVLAGVAAITSPSIARAAAPRQTFHQGELDSETAAELTKLIEKMRTRS
jgi:hypothetical protein